MLVQTDIKLICKSLGSHITTPSSPTPPIDPILSSGDSTIVQPHQEGGENNKMDITSIGSGKVVHTIWADTTQVTLKFSIKGWGRLRPHYYKSQQYCWHFI